MPGHCWVNLAPSGAVDLDKQHRACAHRPVRATSSHPGSFKGGNFMMLAQFRMPALAVTIGVAAVVAPVLSLVAPAQAAAAGHGGSALASAHAGKVSVTNSDHFAGYEATVTAGSATTSAAQFKIPALSCTPAFRAITPVAGVET